MNAQLPRLSRLVAIAALGVVALASGSCSKQFAKCGRKLVVLGIDGMDPKLLRQLIDQKLPDGRSVMQNFKELADEGTFVPLGTSCPPQSPVAWSTFITGMDPGGHDVFDFLHRDPKTYAAISSAVTTSGESTTLPLPGGKQFDLVAPTTAPTRKGVPFWDLLAAAGVRADVYKIPAAFPIQKSRQKVVSDMGTPDLMGGIDGRYAYYTSDQPDNAYRLIGGEGGGDWQQVTLRNGRTTDAVLLGPPSPYVRPSKGANGHAVDPPRMKRRFTVYVDPKEDVVHVEIEDGEQCVLELGKWSEWLRCSFVQGPYTGAPFDWVGLDNPLNGMVKFYLQEAHPALRLYCSAVNIDPRAPCTPISSPGNATVEDACEEVGPFYTAGLPEETKGLEEGTLDDGEFVSQCEDVTAERVRLLDYALDHFDDGLLFFYFGTVDMRCHMLWRHLEPNHPAYDPTVSPKFAGAIEDVYREMDAALGRIRAKIGKETPIVVLSDHGFAPFLRKVELNQWLYEQGYLVPSADALARFESAKDAEKKALESFKLEHPDQTPDVPPARVNLSLSEPKDFDLSKTRAYAVGFNGLYVNLKGREARGCVDPKDRDALVTEIRAKLLEFTDDADHHGAHVVRRADRREEVYHGPHVGDAPDLVVGYDRGYDSSDDTAMGSLTLSDSRKATVVKDNKSRWSGNHLMAPEVVPGVFLTNRKLTPKDPCLYDVTATLLAHFGVAVPPEMRGKSLF
jgi:predicted AlkP superfamily phosphohydrolase/phosphomutase